MLRSGQSIVVHFVNDFPRCYYPAVGVLDKGIRTGYYLKVSNGWGLSNNPGVVGIFVYPDQTYILKKINFRDPTQNKTKEGVMDLRQFEDLKKFIRENVQMSSSTMMYDASYSVELHDDAQTIKIENNIELHRKITKLLPYNFSFVSEE